MLARTARSFSKLRVPEGYSGDLKLFKFGFQTFSPGEEIARVGDKPLLAETSGMVWSTVRDGLFVEEGLEIYEVFQFPSWFQTLPVKATLFFFGVYLVSLPFKNQSKEKQKNLEESLFPPQPGVKPALIGNAYYSKKNLNKLKEVLSRTKPEPETRGALIESPDLIVRWIEHLDWHMSRGVDVLYGPTGIGKSTFVKRLCHVLSNSRVLQKYSSTKTQFAPLYFDLEKIKGNLWESLYSNLGVVNHSRIGEALLKECLQELTKEGKIPIIIFDNAEFILPELDNDLQGARFIRDLILDLTEEGLAKVLLVTNEHQLPNRIRSLRLVDEGCDVHEFLFNYLEGDEVINWMNQVAAMYNRPVNKKDLELFLKYNGSLRRFEHFCARHNDIGLREYLKYSIQKQLDLLTIQIQKSQVDQSELKRLLEPLFSKPKMRFPYKIKDLLLKLIEDDFIKGIGKQRITSKTSAPFYITFNSRISESALRVYFKEHGDSEFLKELINQINI